MSDSLAIFLRERDEALLSLDEAKLRDLVRRHNGVEMPDEPEVFWRAVHKARSAATSLPAEARAASIAWLQARGSEHFANDLQDSAPLFK